MDAAVSTSTTTRADYGLDAPGLVVGFLVGGLAAVAVGWAGRHAAHPAAWTQGVRWLWVPGWIFIVQSGLMWLSSRVGKLQARDRLLDGLALRGDERVLDVACGHGLLLVGAAKRLPRGHAVGLDLWSQRDQQHNSREATLANARAEGVLDRVEVVDGDMRRLPFPDASFDAVVSSLGVHNLPSAAERDVAVAEMARVLRPGGRIAILDIAGTARYAHRLRELGLADARSGWPSPFIFPPARTAAGRKAPA